MTKAAALSKERVRELKQIYLYIVYFTICNMYIIPVLQIKPAVL